MDDTLNELIKLRNQIADLREHNKHLSVMVDDLKKRVQMLEDKYVINSNDLLDTHQICEYLKISYGTFINNVAKSEKFLKYAHKVGRRWRITKGDLENYCKI